MCCNECIWLSIGLALIHFAGRPCTADYWIARQFVHCVWSLVYDYSAFNLTQPANRLLCPCLLLFIVLYSRTTYGPWRGDYTMTLPAPCSNVLIMRIYTHRCQLFITHRVAWRQSQVTMALISTSVLRQDVGYCDRACMLVSSLVR